jgi:transcriptional regulator with XRE-family HTH domain
MIAIDQLSDTQKTTPTFGPRLRELRKARGMGLRALADATGIDTSAISKIENGLRRPPELSALARIAFALGLVESSTEVKYLRALALAERERDPEQATYAEKIFSGLLDLEGVTVVETPGVNDCPASIFCRSFAELVSKSIAEAVAGEATEITVKSSSGGETRFFWFPAHGLHQGRSDD